MEYISMTTLLVWICKMASSPIPSIINIITKDGKRELEVEMK